MPKLTKRAVDAAAADPAGKDAFLWDGDVKGFGLKVTPAGAKSYVLQYRTAEGRSRRYRIGAHGSPWTCDGARAKAVDLLHGLASGVDPLDAKTERRLPVTVSDLVAVYLAEGPAERPNKKARSWELDRGNLVRHVLPLIGGKAMKGLTTADVAKVQADVAAGRTAVDERTGRRGRARVTGGRGTAARTLASLSAMLSFAVARKVIPSNPAIGIEKLKGEKRERFLSRVELVALAEGLAALQAESRINEAMAAAIRLLMLTACRKSEITGLKWAWVDVERSCLRLPDSKTGAKVVPLPAAAMEILADLPRSSPYVLPSNKTDGPIKGLQKAWEAVRDRSTELARAKAVEAGTSPERAPNLAGLRLHDLRHSYASLAVADGVSLYVVGKVLGHRQASTTEIYAHLGDDPLRTAVERTGAKIADALKTAVAGAKIAGPREATPGRRAAPGRRTRKSV